MVRASEGIQVSTLTLQQQRWTAIFNVSDKPSQVESSEESNTRRVTPKERYNVEGSDEQCFIKLRTFLSLYPDLILLLHGPQFQSLLDSFVSLTLLRSNLTDSLPDTMDHIHRNRYRSHGMVLCVRKEQTRGAGR